MSARTARQPERLLDARPDTADFRDRMFEPTLVDVPPTMPLDRHLKRRVPVLDQGGEGAVGEQRLEAVEILAPVPFRDLLGHAHGVVPGQHHDHRPEPHRAGAAREVGQELRRVRHHVVAREVVLGGPDRAETARFGLVGQREPAADHVVVVAALLQAQAAVGARQHPGA